MLVNNSKSNHNTESKTAIQSGVVQNFSPYGSNSCALSFQKGTATRLRHGKYQCITVGTAKWFNPEIIPASHRGQILHQCAVLSVEFALYVVASVDSILYQVLVHIPSIARRDWLSSVAKISEDTKWMRDRLTTPRHTWDQGDVPAYIQPKHKKKLLDILPLWVAVHKYVADNGPLPPTRYFGTAIQVVYSGGKNGVDGSHASIAVLIGSGFKLTWEEKTGHTSIFDIVANTGILLKLQHFRSELHPDKWVSLKSFQSKCSKYLTVQHAADQVCFSLLARSRMIRRIQSTMTTHLFHMGK